MKAVIWHDIGDIRIQEPTDVIGVEAEHAHDGSAAERADSDKDADQLDQIAPITETPHPSCQETPRLRRYGGR